MLTLFFSWLQTATRGKSCGSVNRLIDITISSFNGTFQNFKWLVNSMAPFSKNTTKFHGRLTNYQPSLVLMALKLQTYVALMVLLIKAKPLVIDCQPYQFWWHFPAQLDFWPTNLWGRSFWHQNFFDPPSPLLACVRFLPPPPSNAQWNFPTSRKISFFEPLTEENKKNISMVYFMIGTWV